MTSGGVPAGSDPDESGGPHEPDSGWVGRPGQVDRLIAGRYRLVERVGAGSMGTVWRGFDELLRVDVAVKEIHVGDRLPEAERLVRGAAAMREARNAARLRNHPRVVSVHDAVEDGGLPWIVMELVAATSLEVAVGARGPLPVPLAAKIGLAVLEALVAARDEGLLHRDVKPSNILLADDSRILLTDFGIATHVSDTTLTGPGGSAGTPAYMAPERIIGRPATMAADLFGLGATLYFAVAGVSPFVRDTVAATVGAVLHVDPPPVSSAGPLWPVIGGLLIKQPQVRLGADGARALLTRAMAVGESNGGANGDRESGRTGGAGGQGGPGGPGGPAVSGGRRTSGAGGPRAEIDARAAVPVPSRSVPPPRGPGLPTGRPPAPSPGGDAVASDDASDGIFMDPSEGVDGYPPERAGRRPRLLVALAASVGLLLIVVAGGLMWTLRDAENRSPDSTTGGTGSSGGTAVLPAGMAGTWTGTVTQGPVDFWAEIVLRPGALGADVGTSDYPADGCAAVLRLVDVADGRVTVQERLNRSGPLCRGADRLTLSLRPDGGLDYVYPASNINSVGTGVLRRG